MLKLDSAVGITAGAITGEGSTIALVNAPSNMTLDTQNSTYIPRRLLNTGGCGFIGSNFIHHLFS